MYKTVKFPLISCLITALGTTHAIAESCVFQKAELREWASETADRRPQNANTTLKYSTGVEISATLFYSNNIQVDNYLASSIRQSADGTHLEVDINPTCRWSDGMPIIAEDFITGARIAFNEGRLYPNNSGESLTAADFIKNGRAVFEGDAPFSDLGIYAVDADTIAYETTYPPEFAKAILATLQYAPAPTHAHHIGDDYFDIPLEDHVYSGPYQITRTDGDKWWLERNPYFCDHINMIPDEVTIIFGDVIVNKGDLLVRQEIDLIGNLPNRVRQSLYSGNIPESYYLAHTNTPSISYLAFNTNTPQLANPQVREAMKLALDANFINSDLVGTLSHTMDTYTFRPEGYNPPVIDWSNAGGYTQNINRARELMSAAGYSAENPMTIWLSGVPLFEQKTLSAALSSMYSQIYIDVRVFDDNDQEYMKRSAEGDYDLIIFNWFADYHDPRDFFDAIYDFLPYSVADKIQFESLLTRVDEATTQADRYSALEDIEAFLGDEQYIIPLGFPARIWLAHNRAKFNPSGRPSVRDLVEYPC